jgi:hypothetical protein
MGPIALFSVTLESGERLEGRAEGHARGPRRILADASNLESNKARNLRCEPTF